MTSRPARVPGWLISWTGLLVGLGASVGANVGAARPELGPRLSAAVAPVVALVGAAILERVDLTRTHWIRRGLITVALMGIVGLAFVTSYQHQRALLLSYGNPPLSGALLPVAVDALVLMASVALTVVGEQRRARRAEWEAGQAVPVPAALAVPAAQPATGELVDPLELAGRYIPTDDDEPAGTPEPVPAASKPARRPPVPDQRIMRALSDPDVVPRRPDGTVAVAELDRRWGVGQERAVRLLKQAGLHRAREGEPVPADVDEDVPEPRELEDVNA